jgi:glycosyltransferase involved in cell wall biosynthesis
MKIKRAVVISLMQRNFGILGGQEIRWSRIATSLSLIKEFEFKILCTRSMVVSWEKYNLNPNFDNLLIFEDKHNKYVTWISAQYFAYKNIPTKSILHIPGPGWLVAPAFIIAKYLKNSKLITSLTSCKIKPLKKTSYREYLVAVILSKLSNKVDVLNPSIDLDGLINKNKISISPCSFSDPIKFFPTYPKKNKVVFAGHLQENKGAKILLGILENLPLNINYEFVICGVSDNLDGYNKTISDIVKTKNNIIITRSVTMNKILSDANIFLSLQTWDNYPSQSLIEAMLSGCFIIATDVGDTSLLVKEPWGKVININSSPDIFIKQIELAINFSAFQQREVGEQSRDFILMNHTIEKYIKYLIKIWNELHHYQNT